MEGKGREGKGEDSAAKRERWNREVQQRGVAVGMNTGILQAEENEGDTYFLLRYALAVSNTSFNSCPGTI